MKTKIVYVVVSNDKDIYLEQAWASAYSVKYYNPTAFITLVTDENTYNGIYSSTRKNVLQVVDEIFPVSLDDSLSNMERSRWIKTNLRNLIQGDFLFIDTDTLITGCLSEIDSWSFNIGAVLDYHCSSKNLPIIRNVQKCIKKIYGTALNNDTPYFNSGVLYVKDNESTRQFYKIWHGNWLKSRSCKILTDQQSLARTCDEYREYITPLDGIYNSQILLSVQYLYKAKIVHFFNPKEVDQILNPFCGKDVYNQIKKEGNLSSNLKQMILHCKEYFFSPSILIGNNNALIWLSPSCDFLKWSYNNCMPFYSVISFVFRVIMHFVRKWEKPV